MKKADIAIEYVFLLFIAVITTFIIIALLTKWSGNTSNFLCKLTKTCESGEIRDITEIEATDCPDFQHEIIKGARLCFENGRLGRVKQGICYAILGPESCVPDVEEINNSLDSYKINYSNYYVDSDKALISYDYTTRFVNIK